MVCQRCQQRPATVHFTKIVGGEKSEYHLCEVCAKEKGELNFFTKAAQAFDFNHLLSGLLNMESSPGFNAPVATALRCSRCGMTYNQFTQVGRFGCPHCYESFAQRLEPLLRRIQSSTSHTGKVPVRSGEKVKVKKSLERLRKELQQCVSMEQFERAAQIRDQIRALEQQFGE
ncbi:MAG: UvrB/UvrC motif-containing protein [Alicyclobacillus sp.]|nr:UvrB/UvrC motif-containing protein [Alicyclobacillus sp.]